MWYRFDKPSLQVQKAASSNSFVMSSWTIQQVDFYEEMKLQKSEKSLNICNVIVLIFFYKTYTVFDNCKL